MSKSITATFTRKYILVLGLLFAVSLVAFFVFVQLLRAQVSPEVITLTSRERMLTHRVALAATLVAHAPDPAARAEADALLARSLDELALTHASLKSRTAEEDILQRLWFTGSRLAGQMAALDVMLQRLADEARAVAGHPHPPTQAQVVAGLATRELTEALDTFAELFAAINDEQYSHLHIFALVGEGLTVALLVISGVAVFHPLVRDIEAKIRQIGHLENYYSAIINNVGDGVIAFDRSWRIRYVNAAIGQIWRENSDDLVGRRVGEVLPELVTLGDPFSARRMRTELVHNRPGGGRIIFDATLYIFEFDGDLQCIVSLRDITARKDLENRLRTFFHGIEHSPLSIVITDTKGVIQYANRRCSEISGYSLDEIVGQTPRLFRSGQTSPDLYTALWREIRMGRQWFGEILNRKKSGELYWEFEAISAIKNEAGEVTHFIAIKEDITEQKRQAAQLVEAKRIAEIANRAKSEFLANMSHELRTPLNAVIGFAEIMKMELFGGHSVPAYKEYSVAIYDSARHLLGIINDILDFSKLEAGKVELSEETVRVVDLIQAVLLIVRDRAESGGVRLELNDLAQLDSLPDVHVDALRFKQVMLNIVGNAIKFTPEGGSVTLEAELAPDGGMLFRVRDTGIGMKEEDIPRALERFGQVDASLTRRYEGTGLGLPISKTLIELHGGGLRLTSKEGLGTTAHITLPPERVIHDPASQTPERHRGAYTERT